MKELIAKDLLSIGAVFLRPEEPFTWASGIKSPIYCDNRLILTAPKARGDVESALAKTIKENYPLFVFGVTITAFVLIFTRFFMKMDDGNFLGIALAPDFTYEGFLTERYNNISGRTINEFLVMFFCRHNIIWWKLFISALLIFIVCFFSKLSSYFSGGFSKTKKQIFCSLGFFMMIVSCLNPSVFWFAGSFTYLFPFAGLCAVSLPFVIFLYENRLSLLAMLFSAFGCVAACSQEQSAVCCLCLLAVFFVFIKIRQLSFKSVFLLDLIISVGLTVHLFTSPGMANRVENEAENFRRFEEMNLLDKLFCGISVFFANSFYLSIVLIIVLVALLSVMIYSVSKNKPLAKKILLTVNVFVELVLIAVNAACCIWGKGLAHIVIRRDFLKGEFSPETTILISFGFAVLTIIISLSVFLAVKNPQVGLPVLLCLAAGFGCAMMLSFSSSIFASGQRIYFITNMLVITALVVLISSVPENRISKKTYQLAVFYAVATAVINIFAFTFAEHPLMG